MRTTTAVSASPRLASVLALAALIAVGCTGLREGPCRGARITLWQGGGFSGLTRVCDLQGCGRIRGWEQFPGAEPRTVWQAQLPAPGAVAAARSLRASAGWSSVGTGNMTTRLRYADGATTWSWSWAGVDPPETAPSEMLAALRQVRNLCRQGRAAASPSSQENP